MEAVAALLSRLRRGRSRTDPFAPVQSPDWGEAPVLTVAGCRAAFDRTSPYTIGVEEELMLLDPTTLDLTPAGQPILEALGDSERFAPELRESQLEIVSPVCTSATEASAELASARRRLVGASRELARIAAAGTHPFSSDWGAITASDRYRNIEDEYSWAARRSMVCGLHVHIAIGDADRALAVFNSMRSFLPEIAALAANSPFFEGVDTGLCSIRPKLNQALPRTGVPPAFPSWEAFVEFVNWGRIGGLFPDSTFLWWDLRLHPMYGTIELRAADSQTRVEDAGAIAALVQALAGWLGDRFDRDESLPVHDTHRIAENSWRALRYGIRGQLVDLDTGRPEPARQRIAALLDRLEAAGRAVGCADQFASARALLAGNGADRQRYVADREGMLGLAEWLALETEAA
jgi:carboxylate-amine ligase